MHAGALAADLSTLEEQMQVGESRALEETSRRTKIDRRQGLG